MMLLPFGIYGQSTENFIPYYHLANQAKKQKYLGKNVEALAFMTLAFDKIDTPPIDDLLFTSNLLFELKNYKLSYDFLKEAFLSGYDIEIFNENIFIKNIFIKNNIDSYRDSILVWKKKSSENINVVYKNALDSLYYFDQCVVRDNCDEMKVFNVSKKNLIPDVDYDDTVFKQMIKLIKEYGFPTEQNVGYYTHSKMWILLHHTLRLARYKDFMKIIETAVISGKYNPNQYAWTYDQLQLNLGNKPYYYYGVTSIDELTEDYKKQIDKRRSKMGIKPLEALKL